MNAYELAEFIETGGENIDRKELANMLRQQADRIAELEKQGEPVAWMNIRTSKCVVFINTPPSNDWIPLYTSPQTKPLSDEEIWNWFKENTALTKESALRIARAIEERAWD